MESTAEGPFHSVSANRGGEAGAAGTRARSAAAGQPSEQSRLVIRDESNDRQPDATVEGVQRSSTVYEPETFTVEMRGGKGVITAHPVPCETIKPTVAFVDWLAFTLRPPEMEGHKWLFDQLSRHIPGAQFEIRKFGLFGYRRSAAIREAGLVAWGGTHQGGTVYVSLTGQGCSRIADWPAFHEWCVFHRVRITRIDLAHDDFEAKTVSLEKVKEWYDADGFNAGGRKPQARLNGDWWGGQKGRTVYIGERQNGKLARCYEKGKQQGDPTSPWVRFEVEYHNKDRVLPPEMIARPAAYLAGAYPCLDFLSIDQCRVKTSKKATKIAYSKAVGVARTQYGKLINVMLQVHGGDPLAVCEALRREGMPARLEPYSYQVRTDAEFVYSLDDSGVGHAALDA